MTSALGLGCAELYREPAASRRREVLEVALVTGIRHFDVAPMYGLGAAERELGRFARGRRDEIIIATKFGVTPSALARGLARVQGPVRRLFSAVPALGRRARSSAAGPTSGPAGALLYHATGFDSASARMSLESSLRALGVDYVDLLLLHDPQPGDVRSDDVCAYLEHACAAGHVRAWGIAGEPEPTLRVARGLPVSPQVLQVRADPLAPASAAPLADQGDIVFGVLGGSVRSIVDHVAADPGRRRAWHEAVGSDCTDPDVVAQLLLRLVARERPASVILFGTIRTDHVRSAAAGLAVDRHSSGEDLERFARLLDAELRREPSYGS